MEIKHKMAGVIITKIRFWSSYYKYVQEHRENFGYIDWKHRKHWEKINRWEKVKWIFELNVIYNFFNGWAKSNWSWETKGSANLKIN